MNKILILLLGLHTPNKYADPNIDPEQQFECLAKNIYFEARDQSDHGQLAVAMVTLNRLVSDKYPNTICDVVYENRYRWTLHKCQFSWYCDGKSDRPREVGAWHHARDMADAALQRYAAGYDHTKGSTHYHSRKVDPHWAPHYNYVATIGDHLFYN